MRKLIMFFVHILMGTSVLILSFMSNDVWVSKIVALVILFFFVTSLVKHFGEIGKIPGQRFETDNLKLLVGTFLSSAITWYISHQLGLGPIIANGLIGIIASLVFPKNAGAFYVSSFVGMSSQAVIPSLLSAGLGGLVAGLVIIFSKEIYGGIGGKGGTMAAFSTQFVRIIAGFFA